MGTGYLNSGYFISVLYGKTIIRHQASLSLIQALIIPDIRIPDIRIPDIRAGADGPILLVENSRKRTAGTVRDPRDSVRINRLS
jgi:hypothetical protein